MLRTACAGTFSHPEVSRDTGGIWAWDTDCALAKRAATPHESAMDESGGPAQIARRIGVSAYLSQPSAVRVGAYVFVRALARLLAVAGARPRQYLARQRVGKRAA